MWGRDKPSSCHVPVHPTRLRCAPRANSLILPAKSCSQGFPCDIHHVKEEKSNLWGPWHEEKREECFVSDPLLLPAAWCHASQGWLWAALCPPWGSCWVQLPSCPFCPSPLAVWGGWSRFVLYHTTVLWVVCGADPAWHQLAEFWLRDIPLEVFFFLQSVFPVLQNSEASSQCCKPADYCKLLIFNIDYASLLILSPPMTLFPWEAVPAGVHSLVLFIPPCTGGFPGVKPLFSLWQL